VVAHALPLTYAVQLLQGIWLGQSWGSHITDVIALVVFFIVCTAVSSKVFRWE
jgi:ABC-2 type transport system permease protein